MRRRVAILGSTGSIGRQALEVIERRRETFEVVSLVAGSNERDLRDQVDAWAPAFSGLGAQAAERAASADEVDVVLNAVVGVAGLRASIAALEAGKTLALANKESLVAAGPACAAAARRGGGVIVPVDSEHAALAQCLAGRVPGEVRKLVLTASGGPFRDRADLSSVTVAEALQHPTWNMGPKITVDSATMMNKGLEVIEAHFLFGFAYEDIDVLVHPQSVVHSLVHLRDGSSIMQAAPTDMRIPIERAQSWPEPPATVGRPVDLGEVGQLRFEQLDEDRFPAVELAYRAGRTGGTAPAVLNAANEVAVQAFLDQRITFTAITGSVADALGAHDPVDASELDAVLAADAWARAHVGERLKSAGATS